MDISQFAAKIREIGRGAAAVLCALFLKLLLSFLLCFLAVSTNRGCFQVFDNAYDMLEQQWKENVYCGFGTVIHRVPHDTTATDFSKDSEYEFNRDCLAKGLAGAPSEVVEEFRQIMRHFSSSLYRWQFVRCQTQGCPLCSDPRPPSTPLEKFYEKFGGHMPTPIPVFGLFPPKPETPGGANGPVYTPVGSEAGLHYRTLADFMKLNIPRDRLFADQHYDGATPRHPCKQCEPEVIHRSAAALARHMKMLHK